MTITDVKHRSITRLYVSDEAAILPHSRVFMHGPKWKRHFEIVDHVVTPQVGDRPLKKRHFLLYDTAPDVRELVLEELRHDVFAMWSDQRERLFT